MAVLEKIRSRMGILVSIIIGISLLAFILTDFLSSGKSIFRGNDMEIANISGKSINIKDFEERVNQLSEVYKTNSGKSSLDEAAIEDVREKTWQAVIEENVIGDECSELGLEVTPKELLDMVQGANPHPMIRQLFTDPETKIFDRKRVVGFIKSLETPQKDGAGRKNSWLYIESQITRERLQTKYLNLIKKGLYVTKAQQEAEIKDNSKKVNITYIAELLSPVSDSAMKVSKSELAAYLKKHEVEFQQEKSRDIEYITYDIVPSPEDFQNATKWINDIKPEFQSSTEIKQFVNLNSDVQFVEKYLKQTELPDTLKKLYTGKVGETYGPYFENNTYKIARLADIKNLSDSVKARHILIRPAAQTKEAIDAAKAQADSLKMVIKKGGKFEELALRFSTDGGSAKKGGDLGWFKDGGAPKPVNDACFSGKKGELVVVESQYGVHLIEITDKGKEIKKVQVGILEKKVDPSNTTIQAIFQKASAFAGSNNTGDKFVAALKKQGTTPKSATFLTEEMKKIPGIENSRELLRWTFKAESNSISGVIELGNVFVIARLAQVREKGTAPLNQVQDQVMVAVAREKKIDQLAEKLKNNMNGVANIDALATKLNKTTATANDISFSSYAVPNLGFEPSLIAAAVSVTPNKLSGPIKGENGVFVLNVSSTSDQPSPMMDESMIKMRLAGMYANRVNYEAFNILKKIADIKDGRTKFY